MRTSTAVFLVLFLCLYSSREHGSKLREVVSHVKGAVHELADHARDHSDSYGDRDSAEVRALRDQLRDVERRDVAAQKTLRTVDRSIRALEDRIRAMQQEARNGSTYDVYESGLALLTRQQAELESEREEIQRLQEDLKSAEVRLQAEIDLASIRAERREVEAFLQRERGSPIDRLAQQGGASAR